MNAKDRERECNIYHLLEKLERHQETQNGLILENVKTGASNTTWRSVHTYIIGAIWAAIIAMTNRIW